ncbi:MAG: J domain-containing protein [Clostridiales bacterium]|nr:J domain-containing protein [Clostridiales bacterium]
MDHYRTLQVARNAEPEVIEKAYRALSLKYHPDVVPEDRREGATRAMQRINEAYRVLRDAESRSRYDRSLVPEAGGRGSAWDTFMAKGLVGMFLERVIPDR